MGLTNSPRPNPQKSHSLPTKIAHFAPTFPGGTHRSFFSWYADANRWWWYGQIWFSRRFSIFSIQTTLQTAYQSHNGMHSTLNLLQHEFFWPNMRRTVESMVRGCEECSKARFSPTNTTHKWPKEEEVWSRIHLGLGLSEESWKYIGVSRFVEWLARSHFMQF